MDFITPNHRSQNCTLYRIILDKNNILFYANTFFFIRCIGSFQFIKVLTLGQIVVACSLPCKSIPKPEVMLHNYLKIAFRNLRRQLFYASLNVLGLSLGIASVLLILLYVADELSYDRFYPQADRIFRIAALDNTLEEKSAMALTMDALAGAVQREFPEVAAAARLYRSWEAVRYQDEAFVEHDWQYVDSSFFSVFGYRLLEGDPATALQASHTVVVTESIAKKYFGVESPVGKTLLVGEAQTPYQVTGVMQDPPPQTHLDFTLLGSILPTEAGPGNSWDVYSLYTYIRLKDNVEAASFEEKLTSLVDKYVRPSLAENNGIYLDDSQKTEDLYRFFLQPVTDIHLHSDLTYEMSYNGSIKSIYIFLSIALFILVLACINFMNLSTARYMNRAKEVGIRKTLGSQKQGLMVQFLTESMLMSVVATVLAVVWVLVALHPFGTLSGKAFSFAVLLQPWLPVATLGCMLLVGVLAGSYPAFYLSSFRPADVLKGGLLSSVKGRAIRHALVVFQFAISIALAVCTLLVYQQLTYARSKQLGFDRENVLVISNADQLRQSGSFLQKLEEKAAVQQASVSGSVILGLAASTIFRKQGTDRDYWLDWTDIDDNFLSTYHMTLLEGRTFSPDNPADTARVIINETAQRVFDLEEPLGSFITYHGDDEEVPYEVIGVVKDFHYESFRRAIRPAAFFFGDEGSFISVRLAPGNVGEALQTVEEEWKAAAPGAPFEYSFLDEDYDRLFRAEQRLGRVFTVFTVLAILIACLGLLGLAAFSAERRTKEIGVRKAMGASSWSVVLLLSKDFTRLVLIAFIIAVAPAYYVMHRWLDSFAYHIDIGVGAFAVAGLVALVVAWLTVSYQSLRAASTNPAQSLRNE